VPPTYLLASQEIDMRAKHGLPKRFIFYPAQFWEHKNHITLLKALRLLHDRGEDISLVLVGSKKNNYERVVQAIADLHLQQYVHVLGYVSNDEMYSLYKQADAMVFVSCAGPTNIPPIEALLLGCPLIVSNKYAMPEQVGSAALLVDPLSADDIAQNICHIWHSTDAREKLKQAGFQQIQSWTQQHFNERVKTILDHVIAE
jgi:glycosyltransferase involved in cell wall biosynthesis